MAKTVFVIGGGGLVGATAAQAIALKEIATDIALIDVAEELVHGQADDINHAMAYAKGVRVRVGSYDEIKEDDIIVITCGLAQKPGQSRLELLEANAWIITDVVEKVMVQGRPVYILMVANPVDVLTHVALKASGLPKNRVFGTGTSLDTARLRVLLANELHISPQIVEAYILGEHGDSSFPALSRAAIGGVPIADFPGYKQREAEAIANEIRAAAYKIIEAKKSTYYGIGHVVAKVVEAMLHETASIFPVCSLAEGEYGVKDTVIGLPSLVNARGVHILEGYPLSANEKKQLAASAAIIRQALQSIES